jgi:hypothetical protein
MRAAISSIYRVRCNPFCLCHVTPVTRLLTLLCARQERGLQGFLSGATLRISRKAASSAIAWTVYEGLLIIMRDKGLLKAV